jgi:hypothetical protein
MELETNILPKEGRSNRKRRRLKRYADVEKERALMLARVTYPSYAAHKLGIAVQTLFNWMRDPELRARVQKTMDENKGNIAAAFDKLAWYCVTLAQAKAPDADFIDLVRAASICVEKARLIRDTVPDIVVTTPAAAQLRYDLSRLTVEERDTLRALFQKLGNPVDARPGSTGSATVPDSCPAPQQSGPAAVPSPLDHLA